MEQSQMADQVREFVGKFLQGAEFEDDDDIFALGLVNSLMAMQLVLFLEKEFGIKFAKNELKLDNFRSVERMTAMIAAKQA
ncbi:phosphopantetheine-binding protein [Opitutaceae bacterium]|jgi:acyl carrier protein|nr:phosphopantetheine-binding protein [Opitutaceae bacterium]